MSQKVKLEGAKADKGLICSILHVNPEDPKIRSFSGKEKEVKQSFCFPSLLLLQVVFVSKREVPACPLPSRDITEVHAMNHYRQVKLCWTLLGVTIVAVQKQAN